MSDHSPATLPAFIDTEIELVEAHRSTIERYGQCPAQGRIVDAGLVITDSLHAASGNEVHDAFSEAVGEYIAADGQMRTAEIADAMRGRLLRSRPDVQQDAIDAAWHTAYSWAAFLNEISPNNILRYDGGKGNRSGQLAWDIPWIGTRLTSEVDLLRSGPSPTTLHETDYKSGRTLFSVTSIARSFQFCTHAVLIFHNYPAVNVVEVDVWSTRLNKQTQPVEFRRDELPQYEARVTMAVKAWKENRERAVDDCDAWPAVEKCKLCDARKLCPAVPPDSCAANPAAFILTMHAYEQALKAMKEEASGYVATHGEIIADGLAFGINKPSDRKKSAKLYLSNGDDDAADQDE